jgi:hypothetical protein
MKKLVLSIVVFAGSLLPACCFAWGKTGHGLVAEMAFSRLDDHTRQVVQKYLGDMSIEQAANWMDEIKGDHTKDFMKPWHYVNIADGDIYAATKEANIINQLTRVIDELHHRERMSDEEVKEHLLILFHLVGDLHQPLHVGYAADKGGNTVQLNYNGHGTNLHRLWDSDIIEHEHIDLAACMEENKRLNKDDVARLQVVDVPQWMQQPRKALREVYDFKDNTIDDQYIARSKEVIEAEICIAGIRLAAVLKDVFKS